MKVIKPNSEDQTPVGVKIFLAGSIEMGKAWKWQEAAEKFFEQFSDVTLFNPRRDDWDNSWKQTPEDVNFNFQVNWELSRLEEADFVFFYFDPKTQSPITLIEFGMYVRCSPKKTVLCCPDGFWKKGNIQITAQKYGVFVNDTFEEGLDYLFNELVIHFLEKEKKEKW